MATYQIETEGGHVYQVETADEQGAVEAGLRGAGNNFPLAPQAIAAFSPGEYSKNLADWKQKAAEGKAQHPVAYGVGAVAGATAPLLIPGVGEALEAAPVAGNAVLGAASALNDTDLSKDPGEALKQAAIGATVGGVAGKIGEGISSAADTVGQYAGRFGENQAVKAIGKAPPGMSADEARSLGRAAANDYGLLDFTMGPIGRKETVDAMTQQAGHEIGGIREAASADGAVMSGQEMADAIRARLKDAYSKGGENFDQINALEKELKNIEAMKSTTPSDFAERATAMKTKARGKGFALPTNVDTDVANSLSHINDEAIASKLPEQAGQYADLNKTFGDMKNLGTMIERGEKRNINQRGGHTLYEAGSKFVDELGAHKAGAKVGFGVESALQNGGKALGNAVAMNTTAGVTSTIMNALQTNPNSLGKYAKPLSQAAQNGGKDGLAAMHYVLSQQHPEYNEMWQKNANASAE